MQFLLRPGEWGPGALYTLFAWGDMNPANTRDLQVYLRNFPPRVKQELTATLWMALPIVGWMILALSGLWRRWFWGRVVTLLLFLAMAASAVWVLSHDRWVHSLFLACPLLLLAFGAASRRAEPDDQEPEHNAEADPRLLEQTIALVTVVYTALSLVKPTLGGTEWGARHLLITVPALTLLAWSVIENLLPPRKAAADLPAGPPGAKPLLACAALLVGLSLALQVHGFRIVYKVHRSNRQLTDRIAQSPDAVIVSAVWWAPLNAAPAYYRKKIVYAGDPYHHPAPLFQRMQAAHVLGYTLIGRDSPWNLSRFSRPFGYAAVPDAARPIALHLYLNRFALIEMPESPEK